MLLGEIRKATTGPKALSSGSSVDIDNLGFQRLYMRFSAFKSVSWQGLHFCPHLQDSNKGRLLLMEQS